MKYTFEEIAPLVPLRLPRTNNKDKILFVCHGKAYRLQNKKNIYTLDSHSRVLPNFQISIKSKNFKEEMKNYEKFFDKIYMLCCPINSFLIKKTHYIPNKVVFDNLSFLLKNNGKLYLNNFSLFNKKSKKFSTPQYFLSYLFNFELIKLNKEVLILRKIKNYENKLV